MRKLLLTAALALALIAGGCRAVPPLPTPVPSVGPLPGTIGPLGTEEPLPATQPAPTQTPGTQLALTVLLPAQAGFTWEYEGYAQWGHTLTLKQIDTQEGVTRYTLDGETVTPVTEGDHEGKINVIYTVDSATWLQELSGASILEGDYPKLVILRTPLTQGAKWEQAVTTADGTPVTLDCTIQQVVDRAGKTVYTVRYQQRDGEYYELREITTGLGITKFERFETTQGDTIGYALYGEYDAPIAARALDPWMPPGDRVLAYEGENDFGYSGRLAVERDDDRETVYCFTGVFEDGRRFTQRYYYDKQRGTLTLQAPSDAEAAQALGSPLGGVVVLRFPLAQGSVWSHNTVLDGEVRPLTARVLRYDPEAGVLRVRYSVPGAAGYENDTYIEERTFMLGRGMTGFGALQPGSLNLPEGAGPVQVIQTLGRHMFTYRQIG